MRRGQLREPFGTTARAPAERGPALDGCLAEARQGNRLVRPWVRDVGLQVEPAAFGQARPRRPGASAGDRIRAAPAPTHAPPRGRAHDRTPDGSATDAARARRAGRHDRPELGGDVDEVGGSVSSWRNCSHAPRQSTNRLGGGGTKLASARGQPAGPIQFWLRRNSPGVAMSPRISFSCSSRTVRRESGSLRTRSTPYSSATT